MESATLAWQAEAQGRPWVVLRFVTDTPDQPLGFVAEAGADGSAWRVLAAACRRPARLWALGGLAVAVVSARRRTGDVLEALLKVSGDVPATPTPR